MLWYANEVTNANEVHAWILLDFTSLQGREYIVLRWLKVVLGSSFPTFTVNWDKHEYLGQGQWLRLYVAQTLLSTFQTVSQQFSFYALFAIARFTWSINPVTSWSPQFKTYHFFHTDHYESKGELRLGDKADFTHLARENLPPSFLRFPGKLNWDSSGQRLAISDTGQHRILVTDSSGLVMVCASWIVTEHIAQCTQKLWNLV